MLGLFFRQFWALVWKNYIILARHPIVNIIRAFILPIAYAAFLSVAQLLLGHQNNLGIGSPVSIQPLANTFNTGSLVWVDATQNGSSQLHTPSAIMQSVTRSFSSYQLSNVVQLPTSEAIPFFCPENFNLLSTCFAAVVFNSVPSPDGTAKLNYTLRADAGLIKVDVYAHNSDYEERFFPLQWAVDSAVIELTTGVTPNTPLEWPFTQQTNAQQAESTRLSFVNGVYSLIDLAFFVAFLGVVYQSAGSIMSEQNMRLTPHLQAMGCLRSARVISWHFSMSLLYLPAWIAMGVIWQKRVFTNTNIGLVIGIHILQGLQITSWTMLCAMPFAASPQLAAIASTFFALLLAIIAQIILGHVGNLAACLLSLFFPPAYYIYVIKAICGWELAKIPTDALRRDPQHGLSIIALIIISIINIFIYPLLSLWLEHLLYGARSRRSKRQRADAEAASTMSEGLAISVQNLNKRFGSGKKAVTAIGDLSLMIPKFGIHCLLGSNGSGKSTTLEILAGLISPTSGTVTYASGAAHAQFGTLGIVPQKNVLWDELTCTQHLRLWRSIKRPVGVGADEDLQLLLADCDVGGKAGARAGTLSGGQRRKLQLAIGLVGQSQLLLVDEATSGVDPLARRAIWRALNAVKATKTVIYTTHFLDEADLIGDEITILAAPGKLLAQGSPVNLKSSLGEGYVVNLQRGELSDPEKAASSTWDSHSLLAELHGVSAPATMALGPEGTTVRLNTKDPKVVARALRIVEQRKAALGITSYDVHASSLEDVFLGLMAREGQDLADPTEKMVTLSDQPERSVSVSPEVSEAPPIILSEPKPISSLGQAFIVVRKRGLVLRRSWLGPLLMIAIACCGACIPLSYMSDRNQTCARLFDEQFNIPLYLPTDLALVTTAQPPLISPPNALASLETQMPLVPVQDETTFMTDVNQYRANLTIGGVSFAQNASGDALIAWEASSLSTAGISLLNLASNVFFNQALNSSSRGVGSGPHIYVSYYALPPSSFDGTADAVKWVAFFGCAIAVFPAFFTLYTARERASSVQAMGYSNGLTPLGLWLGHLLFEMPFIVIISTIITVVFAKTTTQFYAPGVLWVVLTLYGMASALVSFCVTLYITSALAAFAVVAGYQVIIFLLYTAAYLLTLTYQLNAGTNNTLTVVHFTMALLSPVVSVVRAAFVSVDLFNLLCDGTGNYSSSGPGAMLKLGGPIVYLILWGMLAFGLLVGVDTGFLAPANLMSRVTRRFHRGATSSGQRYVGEDVAAEARRVLTSNDALRVLGVSKHFPSMTIPAVDDVSFGVNEERLALLGPNGAGKTTTFNVIRGSIQPDKGDVAINAHSVVRNRNIARVALGVCPQFNAIDNQLTVRQHLVFYGRLKGLKGAELRNNVEAILDGAHLRVYESRLASKLSGGNQRKLSLAISLIGNPKVVLIDEWSAGVDAATKRLMWHTLRRATAGKAVVLTTHSMEEASALATRVGIVASKMLAIGTVPQLCSRYAVYEVHLTARTAPEQARARELMAAAFSDAKQAEDVSTRFEVPLEGRTLADLFERLAEVTERVDTGGLEYAVERLGLESVFLKVVRGDRDARLVGEEASIQREGRAKRRRLC